MSAAKMSPEIAQALNAGATVLTPGQRAAHALRGACEDPEPEIYALNGWMQHLWTKMTLSGHAHRMLLNRAQESVLWRRTIADDPEVSALQSVDSLAELATSAYETLLLHGGRAEFGGHAQTTDSRAFLRWAEIFERHLRQQGACTEAQLPALLTAALGRGELPVGNAGLLLVDFEAHLPASNVLFEALAQAGYPVRSLRTAQPAPQPGLLAAEDVAAEQEQAARWLRDRLVTDPNARLALVVPNLSAVRPALERMLSRVLVPEQQGFGEQVSPYEFSLGTTLLETSDVTAAFALLRLVQGPQSLGAISGLLLTPSFGAAGPLAEQLAVAEFDAYELRATRRLRPQISLQVLESMVRRSVRAARMPGLVSQLRALAADAASLAPSKLRQTYARWADAFRALLRAAGWSAAGGASSFSFQVRRRWERALDELSTLDFDGSRPTFAEALAELLRIARATVFAPESQAAPVQVMGPLELGGIPVDGLWFLGAGDLGWPVAAPLNPLLPRTLARLLGIPGARTAEDHERARLLTERIAGSAAECVISYAKLADGQHQRPSPVLAGLRVHPLEAQAPLEREPPVTMIEVPDQASRIPLPDQVIRGGAGILEHQAACAFRAFAQHRLGSTELARQSDGLDHGERGNLVHTVMQLFWDELADQHELRQLTPQLRAEFLERCIVRALGKILGEAESGWDRAYLHTQHIRLCNLLTPWLEQELARPPFAVLTSEKTLDDVRLGPLRLRLRVDRIDETDGGELILDYKTGNAEPREWLSERPDKPQLPLYAVLANEPVAGVAFALLRPGKGLALRGFADSADLFGGKLAAMDTPTFAEQLDQWKAVLTALAEDFHEGRADVQPKQFPQTCGYCAHRILCRVDPTLLDDGVGDEEEGGAEQVHG